MNKKEIDKKRKSNYQREHNFYLHMNNLCQDCAKAEINYFSNCLYCKDCHDKRINRKRRLHEFRYSHGLCADCGQPLDSYSICRCSKCLQKQRESYHRLSGNSVFDEFR